jgi:hypothetical protein
MMAGLVVPGAGTAVAGAGLGRAAAPASAGPWLAVAAGAAGVAAGLFRRDHMLLAGPGFAGESWHDQVHDAVSGVGYGAMLAAPLVLARRWRDDPERAPVGRPVRVLALASAVALAVFASRDRRAVQRRGAADRGHPCAGRRDAHRGPDAYRAGNWFRCRPGVTPSQGAPAGHGD